MKGGMTKKNGESEKARDGELKPTVPQRVHPCEYNFQWCPILLQLRKLVLSNIFLHFKAQSKFQ